VVFFFSSRRRHTRSKRDWSSDVCSSDLMYLILRYLMGFDAFVEIAGSATFQMPAKEKHSKPFILTNQNMALNQSSGGKFYRSAKIGRASCRERVSIAVAGVAAKEKKNND